jgi:hypothetical protein
VVSLLTKLELRGIVFGRLDKSLCDKLIKNGSFVRLQIRAGSLQQIAKDRNFQVREIIICHDTGPFFGNGLVGLAPVSPFRPTCWTTLDQGQTAPRVVRPRRCLPNRGVKLFKLIRRLVMLAI